MTGAVKKLLLCLLLASLLNCGAERLRDSVGDQAAGVTEDEFKRRRLRLVEQLRGRGIRDQAVLEALKRVPRHRFVPAAQIQSAYADHPLPIGRGQTISQPYIVAYMTEAAEVSRGEKVLEIGTGSGYQAAVLAEVAREVYTVEIIPDLAESAARLLGGLGYQNIRVKTGNGYEGWAEHAPYDAIVVTAAPSEIPRALVEQLAVNGKMVIPVGDSAQEMVVVTKGPGGLVEERTIPVRFVPMVGKPPQ